MRTFAITPSSGWSNLPLYCRIWLSREINTSPALNLFFVLIICKQYKNKTGSSQTNSILFFIKLFTGNHPISQKKYEYAWHTTGGGWYSSISRTKTIQFKLYTKQPTPLIKVKSKSIHTKLLLNKKIRTHVKFSENARLAAKSVYLLVQWTQLYQCVKNTATMFGIPNLMNILCLQE